MEELRAKIEDVFDHVVNARSRLLSAKELTMDAKESLKNQESVLLVGGKITGKNEKEREAQLRIETTLRRNELVAAEKAELTATYSLEIALDARRNLESMLRIEELGAA